MTQDELAKRIGTSTPQLIRYAEAMDMNLDVRLVAKKPVVREEKHNEAKLAALRLAVDEGDASGIAKGRVFGRVRKKLKLAKRQSLSKSKL